MKTQFTKQDLIELCNNFLSYFIAVISGSTHALIFKNNLKNLLNIDEASFENLVIDIKNYTNTPIFFQKIHNFDDKILHIEILTLSREKILKIGSVLLYTAVITNPKKGIPAHSLVLDLGTKFYKLLHDDLNLESKCALEFMRSLRISTDDKN